MLPKRWLERVEKPVWSTLMRMRGLRMDAGGRSASGLFVTPARLVASIKSRTCGFAGTGDRRIEGEMDATQRRMGNEEHR
jgi:hypothetical protein